MYMSIILQHIILIVVSLFSLVFITINEDKIDDTNYTRSNFQSTYHIYEDYNFAISKIANLKYESYDNSEFASHINSCDNMPCTIIAGHHFRLEEKRKPEKWDKYDVIPDWNFFINIYETNLPVKSAESYFAGIIKGITATLGDTESIQRGLYNLNYPTLLHPDVVGNEPANTIVIFTDNLAYHITAVDSSEYDEIEILLSSLSVNIPPEIVSPPIIAIVFVFLLHIFLLIELFLCVKSLKGIGSDNKVARGFSIFTFVMICAYLIASLVHSSIAIFDIIEYCDDDYITCTWIYSGSVFFLSVLLGKLLKHSHLQEGVGFILPRRWKTRLQDNKISRVIVVLICYPCLISLVATGFLAIPFVIFVYIVFLLLYLIAHAVKWIISGSIN